MLNEDFKLSNIIFRGPTVDNYLEMYCVCLGIGPDNGDTE